MVNSSSLILLAATASAASAFTANVNLSPVAVAPTASSTAIHAVSSRRDIFTRTTSAVATTLLTAATGASPAFAASTPPTKEELERIKKGYENIQYLLNNWEKETTVCRENGGECKRDADAARRYLGLRSTTDPLFQIEKVFAKVRFMVSPSMRMSILYCHVYVQKKHNHMMKKLSWGGSGSLVLLYSKPQFCSPFI